MWYLLRRNEQDSALCKELKIWPDLITVHRYNPRKDDQYWQANPYWTEVNIRKNLYLENYLTLKGGGRVIELGAFLSPEERKELFNDLSRTLRKLSVRRDE